MSEEKHCKPCSYCKWFINNVCCANQKPCENLNSTKSALMNSINYSFSEDDD